MFDQVVVSVMFDQDARLYCSVVSRGDARVSAFSTTEDKAVRLAVKYWRDERDYRRALAKNAL